MKQLIIILFAFSGSIIHGQVNVFALDVKTGIFNTETYSETFSKRENKGDGNRFGLEYPYVSLPFDNGKGMTTKLFSPYLNVSFGIRFNPYFELAAGFSYFQIRNNINYNDFTTEGLSKSVPFYRTYITEASGRLINNIYGIQFAPVYRIFNTKLIFGLVNVDISKSKTNFEGTKTQYNIIYKQNSWTYGHQYPQDSIVTIISTEKVNPTHSLNGRIYFPLSFGIEQEIPINTLRYLIGAKIIYSSRSYAPISFIGYIGIRLSNHAYTWKE